MRRVSLLMVLAVAAFMSLGTAGAMAGGKAGNKPAGCKYGKGDSGKCKGKPKPKPKPKPKDCQYGAKDGQCNPKPPECPNGADKDGNCLPKPPIVVHPPKEGPCSQADLVLLEDLLKGTGALACVYLGDNAPNASGDKDCPDALLALPLDNLIGACVYLPPADVESTAMSSAETAAAVSSAAPVITEATADSGAKADSGATGVLQGLLSQLTGLLKLGG